MSYQPIFILPEGTQRTTGKDAQRNNIMAAKAVAQTVRTTLGPKGMDKMIVDSIGDIIVTNDGVTILEEMQIEHPAAKMVVEVAKTQEKEVGDGTTTAVVLAGELMRHAEGLLDQNIHPTVIVKGFRLAANKSHQILNNIAEEVNLQDEKILKSIALTAMTGKGAENSKEHLSNLVVKAIKKIASDKINTEDIKLEKRIGGMISESELVEGIILDKEKVHPSMPSLINNAKIALIDTAIEIKETEIDAKIQINNPEQIEAYLEQEERTLKRMVEKIIESEANVVFCQKGIDDTAQHYLGQAGILAVRRIPKSDLEKLAKATNGEIISNLNSLTKTSLGIAGIVYSNKKDDDDFIFVEKCKNPKAVTILIKGGTEHVVDEIQRALEDAIGDLASVIKMKKAVGGAGAAEIELAKELRKYSNTLSGREQLAVQAFANAMEAIPRTLAENAGLDPIDVLTKLTAGHKQKNKWAGIDVFTGKIMDSWKKGVIEPLKIKTQAISSATEVAEMILRIDDVISGGKKENTPAPNQMPMGM